MLTGLIPPTWLTPNTSHVVARDPPVESKLPRGRAIHLGHRAAQHDLLHARHAQMVHYAFRIDFCDFRQLLGRFGVRHRAGQHNRVEYRTRPHLGVRHRRANAGLQPLHIEINRHVEDALLLAVQQCHELRRSERFAVDQNLLRPGRRRVRNIRIRDPHLTQRYIEIHQHPLVHRDTDQLAGVRQLRHLEVYGASRAHGLAA